MSYKVEMASIVSCKNRLDSKNRRRLFGKPQNSRSIIRQIRMSDALIGRVPLSFPFDSKGAMAFQGSPQNAYQAIYRLLQRQRKGKTRQHGGDWPF